MTEIVEELREPLRKAAAERGISFAVEVDPDLCVRGDAWTVKRIVAHLVLVARDALLDAGAVCFSARREVVEPAHDTFPEAAGEYVVLRVDAGPGPLTGGLVGVDSCRDWAAALHGFLDVSVDEDAALSLSVFIPAVPVTAESEGGRRPAAASKECECGWRHAAVYHSDPRVLRTLVSALSHLGYSGLIGPTTLVEDGLLWEAEVVFADSATAQQLRALDLRAMVVEVVARGETTAGIDPVLTVPFEIGELEALLERALEREN